MEPYANWVCNCAGAARAGQKLGLSSLYVACPYCGRSREHVALLEGVRELLAWLDEGGPVEPSHRILAPLREARERYVARPDFGSDLPTSPLVTSGEERQLSAADRSALLWRGHRDWRNVRTSSLYVVVSVSDDRVIVAPHRTIGSPDAGLSYKDIVMQPAFFLQNYVPC